MARKGSEWAARIKGEVQKSIIGQDVVIERLLVALLSCGCSLALLEYGLTFLMFMCWMCIKKGSKESREWFIVY